jgi:predicted metallo-beta-lactamase superfamily hydrolase
MRTAKEMVADLTDFSSAFSDAAQIITNQQHIIDQHTIREGEYKRTIEDLRVRAEKAEWQIKNQAQIILDKTASQQYQKNKVANLERVVAEYEKWAPSFKVHFTEVFPIYSRG